MRFARQVVRIILFAMLLTPALAQETININSAPAEELMRIPGIGRSVASRIVEFRLKHGPFRRTEELIAIKGMNARRYRQISRLIRI